MADESQTAVLDALQTDTVAGEQAPVAAREDGLSAAAAQGVAAIDWANISDDDLLSAVEQREAYQKRIKQERDNGFNAGKQNRDKELRLERGAEDVARAWQEHISEKYGVELDESDRREAPLWVKANRDRERVEYWTTHTNQVLDAYDAKERDNIANALAAFDGEPDQIEQISRQVIDEAVKRQSGKRIADLTLDDIPAGSKLHTSIRAFMDEEMAKEAAAQAQEREAQPPPPRTSEGGASVSRTQASYANLTPQQIADLPEDEFRVAMGYVR